MDELARPRRRGRPRGADSGDTKARIVAAAAAEFAEHGYEATSIRAVARRAGVDPALVHHYFDDKAALVSAVVEVPLRPDHILRDALGGPVDELGERLLRGVLAAWEAPAVRSAATVGLRSAMGKGPVARMIREFLRREVMLRIATELGGVADAELRAELAASQLVGVVMLRYVIGFEPIASLPVDDVVARVAPAVQWHLAGTGPILDSRPAQGNNSARDE